MKDRQATCSKCGIKSEEVTSTIVIGLPGNRLDICPHCASRGHANTIKSLEEADHFIAETQQTLASLESFVTEHPKQPEVAGALTPFAMTPLSTYRMLQHHLAAFQIRRMEIITEKDGASVLSYELEKAVQMEDFDREAQLRDKLKKYESELENHR